MGKILDGFTNIRTITHAHTQAVSKGDPLVIGDRLCVAMCNAEADEAIGWMISGKTTQTKEASLAIGAGKAIYWDASNTVFTTTSTDNLFVGISCEAAAAADADINFILGQA